VGHADELVQKTDLRQLATHLLGAPKGSGPNQKWPSPDLTLAQTGQTPPMTIFVGNDRKERFTCWSTGIKGDALDLVREVKRVDVAGAMEFLRDWNGVPAADIPVRKLTPKIELLATPRELERFASRSVSAMRATEVPAAVTEWLSAHGLDQRSAAAAGVGVALRTKVPTHKYAVQLGVVLPNFDVDNTLVGAQVRLLNSKGAKYLDVRTEARTTAVSFHRPASGRRQGTVVVCEGVADAVVMAGEGYPAIAVIATSRIDGAAEVIGAAARGRKVLCAFDGDEAGRRAQHNLITELQETCSEVAEMYLPDGQDVAAMKARSPEWLTAQLRGHRLPTQAIGAMSL